MARTRSHAPNRTGARFPISETCRPGEGEHFLQDGLVIVESVYWRRDLYRAAVEVRKKSSQRVWREASLSVLEMKLMTGCYFVRRLHESGKVPDSLLTSTVSCVQVLPRKDARPHRFRPPIDFMDAIELFNFGGCTDATVSVQFFINQFIHSEVLVYLGPDETTGESIAIVASDTGRQKRLLCVWLNDIADLFERVAITEPTEWSSTWDDVSESYCREICLTLH